MIWHALFLCIAFSSQDSSPLWTNTHQVDAKALAWDQAEKQGNKSILRSGFLELDSSGIAAGRGVRLDLFGDTAEVVLGEGKELYPGYHYYEGEGAAFTVGPEGAVAGSISHDGREYELVYAGSGNLHSLREIEAAQQLPCGQNHTHSVTSTGGSTLGGGGNPPADDRGSGATNIDVCVFYTAAAKNGAGGKAAMESLIVQYIGQANTAATNSGVNHEFRLVRMKQVTYTETGTSTDLSRFRSTSDGYFDGVHNTRTNYGGDLMNLIINSSSSFCGVGYLMSNDSPSFRTSAFNVTVRGCLSNRTMTHEMGHNLGSHHDRANAGGSPAYFYSYGWRTGDNRYRTIMAYSPGTRVNKWSGPNVTHQGYTMGNGSNDNVRSLNRTRTSAEAFYSETVLFWDDVPGGIPGTSGKPTIDGKGTTNNVDPIEITLDNMPAGAPGILVVGFSEWNVPFSGGTLVPAWDFAVNIAGSANPIVLDGSALGSLGGTELWLQAFFVDGGAVQGLAGSDGLKVTIP